MSTRQSDLLKLHNDILEYLTKRSRIMSCQKLHIWDEFTAVNNFQYADYSREDLRREFLETILPKVFTYDLTTIQRRKIEIFASHNGFKNTETGFKELPLMVNLPTEGIHFANNREEAKEHRLSCVIGDSAEVPVPDQKIKAWVSAVNSTDDELVFNRLLPEEELRTRLSESQETFRRTGDLPPNLTATIARKICAYRNKSQQLSYRILPNLKQSKE